MPLAVATLRVRLHREHVIRGAVNRNTHLRVFRMSANVTRRTKAHGDFADRRVGLRVAGTCPEAND